MEPIGIAMVIAATAFLLAMYILGELNVRYTTKLMKEQNQQMIAWLKSLEPSDKAGDESSARDNQPPA